MQVLKSLFSIFAQSVNLFLIFLTLDMQWASTDGDDRKLEHIPRRQWDTWQRIVAGCRRSSRSLQEMCAWFEVQEAREKLRIDIVSGTDDREPFRRRETTQEEQSSQRRSLRKIAIVVDA